MRKLTFTLLAAAALAGCSTSGEQYRIEGNAPLGDLAGKSIYLSKQTHDNGYTSVDSALIASDLSFLLEGTADPTAIYYLQLEKDGKPASTVAALLLESGVITVAIEKQSTIGGTPLNESIQQAIAQQAPLKEGKNRVYAEYRQLSQAGTLTPEVDQSLSERFDSLQAVDHAIIYTFIEENIDNLAGAFMLEKNPHLITDDEKAVLLAQSSTLFRSTPAMQKMEQRVELLSKVAIGKPFAELTMQDMQGNEKKLSDYAGKGTYLVVDFWASWCGPCVRAMPELIAIYNEYNPKGVDFLGVSLDRELKAWKEGSEKSNIPWAQISDLQAWQSQAATVYGVNSIPHLMLLAPDGTILAKNLDDASLLAELEKLIK